MAEVVAERIGHELGEVAISLVEDQVPVSRVALFQLLLEVSAAVLILAQVEEFSLQIFDSDTRESVDYQIVRVGRVVSFVSLYSHSLSVSARLFFMPIGPPG